MSAMTIAFKDKKKPTSVNIFTPYTLYKSLTIPLTPLDLISIQSSAAYSLRRLRNAYTGNAIRVRRDIDNAEANIGFTSSGDLDQVDLMNHVGYQNLLTYSEQFENVAWDLLSGAGETVTTNAALAPNGQMTADLTTCTSTNSARTQAIAGLSLGLTVTHSVYLKKATVGTWVRVGVYHITSPSNQFRCWVNLDTGTIGTADAIGVAIYTSSSITNVGGGWYRVSITGSIPLVTDYAALIASAAADNDATRTVGHNKYVWGAQVTLGATAQTYRQTVATANQGNGFVRTWYDQSINGFNATQTTAGNQPQIVTSGVVNIENTKPVIRFSATTWLFNTATSADASLWGANPQTMNVLARSEVTSDRDFFSLLGSTATVTNLRSLGGPSGSTNWRYTTGADISNGDITNNAYSIATGRYAAGANDIRTNGVVRATGSGGESSTAGNLTIGARSPLGNGAGAGVIGEAILFNSSISNADAFLLERNQGTYYEIAVV